MCWPTSFDMYSPWYASERKDYWFQCSDLCVRQNINAEEREMVKSRSSQSFCSRLFFVLYSVVDFFWLRWKWKWMCLLYQAIFEGLVFQHKFTENTPEHANSLVTSFGNHCISTVTSVLRGLKRGLKNMACNRFRAFLGRRVLHTEAVQSWERLILVTGITVIISRSQTVQWPSRW